MTLFQALHFCMLVHMAEMVWGILKISKGIFCGREIANNACKGRSSVVFNKRPFDRSILIIMFPPFNDAWDVGTVSYLLRGALTQNFNCRLWQKLFQRVENQPFLPKFLQYGYAGWDGLAISLEITRPSACDQASTWVGELFLVGKKEKKEKKKTKRQYNIFNFGPVEYADIPILDFSVFDKPGGKEKLAGQLKEAVQQTGISAPLPVYIYIYIFFPQKKKKQKNKQRKENGAMVTYAVYRQVFSTLSTSVFPRKTLTVNSRLENRSSNSRRKRN